MVKHILISFMLISVSSLSFGADAPSGSLVIPKSGQESSALVFLYTAGRRSKAETKTGDLVLVDRGKGVYEEGVVALADKSSKTLPVVFGDGAGEGFELIPKTSLLEVWDGINRKEDEILKNGYLLLGDDFYIIREIFISIKTRRGNKKKKIFKLEPLLGIKSFYLEITSSTKLIYIDPRTTGIKDLADLYKGKKEKRIEGYYEKPCDMARILIVQDTKKDSYLARVEEISEDKDRFLIHFIGYGSKHDVWMHQNSKNLKFYSHEELFRNAVSSIYEKSSVSVQKEILEVMGPLKKLFKVTLVEKSPIQKK